MPTYDYRCEKCGNEFEDFLPMAKRAEPTEEPCDKQLHRVAPVCGGKIAQVPGSTPTAFAYDNISSPGHTKKPPDWFGDRMKHIKKNTPGGNLDYNF